MRDHCGDNPGDSQRIVAHRNFPALVHTWRQIVDTHWRDKTTPFRIVCFCNRGRDRSVGVAVLLGLALRKLGYTAKVTHTCQRVWRWHRRNNLCGEHCQACFGKAANEVKDRCAEQTKDMWEHGK